MKRLLPALALAATVAAPAAAFDIDAMTGQERDALRAEIRAYLLDNPEVLMEAIGVLEAREAAAQEQADGALVAAHAGALFEDEWSWVGGNPEGDVTLVEFIDYRCGYCRRAHPEVEELVASDGGIRLVVKEFPILGESSVASSRFAIAVGNLHGDDAYKSMHDALIALRGDATREALSQLAQTYGLDPEPIFEEMESDAVTRVIEGNRALAQALRISGTPTFVLDDRMLRGYVPLAQMREIVAEVRAEES